VLIALQDSYSIVERYCVSTGNEVEVAKSSAECGSVFLSIGKYDLTAFSDCKSTFSPTASDKILETSELNLIRWTGFYESPLTTEFTKGKKLLALISLELSSLLESSYYHPKIIVPAVSKTIERIKQSLSLDAAFYGGIKQSDLHIIVPLHKAEQLFEINLLLRQQKLIDVIEGFDLQRVFEHELPPNTDFPVFHRIETDLLVSFPEVIDKLNCDSDELDLGAVDVRVTIKANSTSEGKVRTHFKGFEKQATTSGNKWLAVTNQPMKFSNSLKQILDFRKELHRKSGGESFTKTTYFTKLSSQTQATEYKYDFHKNSELDIPDINSKLEQLGTSAKELYYATDDIIRKYLTLYQNNLYKGYIQDISNFFPLLVNEQNDIVEKFYDHQNRASTRITEAHQAISVAADAISQRLDHKYSIHIKAVTNLLQTLSQLAREKITDTSLAEGALIWKGFVFVSRLHGYSLKPYDIYTIPHVSVNQPLSSTINWHSLTHEISHWIFDELNLSQRYEIVIQESIKRMGIVAAGSHLKHEIARYDQLVYEYFATWFDYYHFYDEDQTLFQIHIWRSWSSLSFTEDKISEYLSRSFLVYVFQHKEQLIKAYFNDAEKGFIAACFKDYYSFIKNNVSPEVDDCIFDGINRFEVSLALDISKAVIPIFFNTLDEYCFDDFRASLHNETDETKECVSAILEGEVYTNKLDNPFLVMNKLLKHLSVDKPSDKELWKLETALLFSFGVQTQYDE